MKKLLVSSIMVVLICISCSKDDREKTTNETIKIGVLMPFSLEGAILPSESRLNAVIMAVEEINQEGGVLEKKLEIITADNEGDEELCKQRAKELIDQDCIAIIGPSWSSRTISTAIEVTIPRGILLITPSATSTEITHLDDNGLVWRTVPSDAFQGKVAAQYVNENLGFKTAGVIYVDNSYGKSLADIFTDQFEDKGGRVITKIKYEFRESYDNFNFDEKVKDLFKNQPELIYLISYGQDGVGLTVSINNTIDLSYGPVFFGCDANHLNYFLPPNSPKEVVDGMMGLAYSASESDPNVVHFTNNFTERFGKAPNSPYSSSSYDALYLIAYSILQGKSYKSRDIADNLLAVSSGGEVINPNEFKVAKSKIEAGIDINYNGVAGSVDFDENGDVMTGTYTVWQITDNKFVEVSIISYP